MKPFVKCELRDTAWLADRPISQHRFRHNQTHLVAALTGRIAAAVRFQYLPVPHFLPERLNIIDPLLELSGRLAKPEPSSVFDERFFGSHEWILTEGVKAVKM
jgi:hypothetical protein